MKTLSQILLTSLFFMAISLAGFISIFYAINSFRDIITIMNPSLEDRITFEFTILATLLPVSTALLVASLSSWIALTHSHALSKKKHFMAAAEGACDELTKLITSYSYNNGNDKESTEQQIRTCRILCDKFLTDSFFGNKGIFNAWGAVGLDIEILINLKKLVTEFDKELDIELIQKFVTALVQKFVTELDEELDKELVTELNKELVQKLVTELNKELNKNLAKELDIELVKRLDSTVEKLIELRMMITKTL